MLEAGMAILVVDVDDAPGWEGLIDRLFSLRKHRLLTATSGEEAIQKYLDHQPDILILNLSQPDLDGLDIIDYIRNTSNNSDIYILALTDEQDAERKVEALQQGANDFLIKPFTPEELNARLTGAKRQLRLNRQLRLAYERISKEIDTVASLQTKLLPNDCLFTPNISLQCVYHPSGRASGDYYDYFSLNNHTLRLVIADVSGHGARAAFLMAMVRALFRSTESYFLDLSETLQLINRQLMDIIGSEPDFVTLFAADVDIRNKTLTYVNAGHCPGLLIQDGMIQETLTPTETILGFFPLDFIPRQLEGDAQSGLFLFTDGYYEWEYAPNQTFGLDSFLSVAAEIVCKKDFTLEELEERLTAGLELKPSFRDDRSALWVQWGECD